MLNEFPADIQAFVRNEIDQQHYASENELLVEAIRLLQRERTAAIAGIERGIDSLERGEGIPLDDAFASLRDKHNIPAKP